MLWLPAGLCGMVTGEAGLLYANHAENHADVRPQQEGTGGWS